MDPEAKTCNPYVGLREGGYIEKSIDRVTKGYITKFIDDEFGGIEIDEFGGIEIDEIKKTLREAFPENFL